MRACCFIIRTSLHGRGNIVLMKFLQYYAWAYTCIRGCHAIIPAKHVHNINLRHFNCSNYRGSETKKFCLRDFEILRFPGDFQISQRFPKNTRFSKISRFPKGSLR